MNAPQGTKLYAYVDESGQDTQGQFFVVSVVVLATEHEIILQQLEAVESRSRKGKIKWHHARYAYRQAYIDELANLTRLSQSLFFEVFSVSGHCKAFFPPVERRERRETVTLRWLLFFYLYKGGSHARNSQWSQAA